MNNLQSNQNEKNYSKVLSTFPLGGVNVAIYYDTKRVKEDLVFPVKYRVTYNRDRYYYGSGIDLTEEEWKRLLSKGRLSKDLTDKRVIIERGYEKIKKNITELLKESNGFSFQALSQRLYRRSTNSVIGTFINKIETLEAEGRISTASSYRCALNAIKRCDSKDLKFQDITVEWLKKLEAFILSENKNKKKGKRKNSITTVGIYMRCLRSIMNEGRDFYSPEVYPFGKKKYLINNGHGRKLALNIQQIRQLIEHPLPTIEGQKYRDLWYFSFLCNGINVKDLLRLQYQNINKHSKGEEIYFYRSKTVNTHPDQEPIKATLLPPMREIIDRWGVSDRKPDNYIFGYLTDKTTPTEERMIVQNVTRLINKRMKKLGEELGYGKVTSYWSRHSFASILKNNNVNVSYISEALGHSDLSTTKAYLASFDEEARANFANILTDNK